MGSWQNTALRRFSETGCEIAAPTKTLLLRPAQAALVPTMLHKSMIQGLEPQEGVKPDSVPFNLSHTTSPQRREPVNK